MTGESKAQRGYHRHKVQLQHAVRSAKVVGCHHDDQLKLPGINLFKALDDCHMLRQRLLQIVRSLVADFHQQGCWLAMDEGKDTLIHVIVAGDGPVEALSQRVERPKPCIVALCGNDLAGTNHRSHVTRQIVGTTDVSAQHGDDIQSHAVHTHHSRVFVLVFDIRSNGANADAHSPYEHKRIEILPALADIRTTDDLALIFPGKYLTQQQSGYMLALLTNLYDGYLHFYFLPFYFFTFLLFTFLLFYLFTFLPFYLFYLFTF